MMNRVFRFLFLACAVLGLECGCFAAYRSLDGGAAQKRWAVVNTSSCFLRARPDYESSNETQCLMGTVLEVTAEDRYWRKVSASFYKDYWTNDLVLAYMTDAQKDEYVRSSKWICVAEHSHLYSEPDYGAKRVGDFELCNIIRRAQNVPGGSPEWVKAITAAG